MGALEIFFVVSILTLQQTISLHALAALALLVPAIAFTPLIRRPLSQPETGPNQTGAA